MSGKDRIPPSSWWWEKGNRPGVKESSGGPCCGGISGKHNQVKHVFCELLPQVVTSGNKSWRKTFCPKQPADKFHAHRTGDERYSVELSLVVKRTRRVTISLQQIVYRSPGRRLWKYHQFHMYPTARAPLLDFERPVFNVKNYRQRQQNIFAMFFFKCDETLIFWQCLFATWYPNKNI